KVPSQNTALEAADVHLGEQALGNTYFFVNASSRVFGGSIPPSLNTFFDVFFSLSLDGITSNLHHRGQIDTTSIHAQIVGSNTMNVSFTATFPSDPQLPSLINQVNLNYDGVGTAYGLIPAPIVGACCFGTSCNQVNRFDCARSGGVYRGDN